MALRSCGTASASQGSVAKMLASQGRRFLTTGAKHTPASRDLNATEEAKVAVVVGEKFQMERSFTSEDVASYVQLCGDTNPIHTSESAAQIAGFRGRVVQGMLYAGLFPAIIGSQFERAVYVSQTLNFRAPVLVGEPLCAEVEVTAVKKLRHHYRVTFATQCYKKEAPISYLVLYGALRMTTKTLVMTNSLVEIFAGLDDSIVLTSTLEEQLGMVKGATGGKLAHQRRVNPTLLAWLYYVVVIIYDRS